MRSALAILEGQKIAVVVTVGRFSHTPGYAGRVDRLLCVEDVRANAAELLTDHLWIRGGARLEALDLQQGDTVAFTGTVTRYTRQRGDQDYYLVRPYQCRVLERAPIPVPEPAQKPAPIVIAPAPAQHARGRIMHAIPALTAHYRMTPEKRSAAAKLGWWRRRGLIEPTTYERFVDAIKAADPCALLLYAADVAEAAQHVYIEQFPGDLCTLDAIAVARRYARGEATDKERLKTRRMLIKRDHAMGQGYPTEPYRQAMQAAGFLLSKSARDAASGALDWAGTIETGGRDFTRFALYLPALQGLARRA
jgi:hypothetical protein